MYFKEVERVEYKENILFEVIFQARFPEIMKISHEDPVKFQDIIRKEDYPESDTNIPTLPSDMPEGMKMTISASVRKEFLFFSEEKNWQVSLGKDFIALSCKGDYLNYDDFRNRLKKVLNIFIEVYQPAYFSRIGLRYRNIVNHSTLPLEGTSVRDYIPDYIFPELGEDISKDVVALEKLSQFEDENIKTNVSHVLAKLSGKYGQKQINDEESYLIDIDCYYQNKIRGIDDVLTRCDSFKKTEWNIFQWSITDKLQERMGSKQSSI